MSIQEMRRVLIGFAAVVMMLAFPAVASAEDAGPQLLVRTASGRTTFRIGERIPLELVFTGPGDHRFEMDTGQGERSPGMTLETAEVSPEGGWTDPLKIYYESLMGYAGDWLSGYAALSAKPIVIAMDLNDWVRFDQPGRYQIVVTSRRVAAASSGVSAAVEGKGLSLRSNPMEIQIVPSTAAWRKAELARIVAALADRKNPAKPGYPVPVSVQETMADLRSLGTADAAAVMARHLRPDDGLMYECELGLAGLPEKVRPAALADLNAEMDDPNFPISSTFLDTMAVLQLTDGANWRDRRRLFNQAWQAAFETLGTKQGKARAATVEALLNSGHKGTTSQQKAEMGRILAADLTELPVEREAAALQFQWDLVRANVTLPELEKLAELPLKDPASNAAGPYSTRKLKSAALRRWYELDPVGARQEIMREIGTAHPELTARALEFLPKEKFPQFEPLWAERFVSTGDALFAGLLAKFGEGDAVGLVESQAQANIGKWGCAPQDAALAYVAEFDPGNALPLLEQAIDARGKGKTGCYHSLFQGIAQYATAPVLTKAATEAVNDPDGRVVADALIYLKDYGDASAKAAILNRYAAWTAQWRGRADELDSQRPNASQPAFWQGAAMGRGLVGALLANQGWVATPGLIAKALAGCVGKRVCQDAKQLAREAERQPYLVGLNPGRNGSATFTVAQYQIKSLDLLDAKVAQFPKGTRFVLTLATPNGSDQRKLEDKVKAIFAKHGMVLVEPFKNG